MRPGALLRAAFLCRCCPEFLAQYDREYPGPAPARRVCDESRFRPFSHRPEDAGDCRGELVPLPGFNIQLSAAFCGQPVILRLAVIFRGPLAKRYPSSLDQTVQCRIKRSLLDAENIFGIPLDRFSDR